MRKYKIYYYLLTLVLFISACADDKEVIDIKSGDNPVQIAGIVPRAGTPRNDIHVKAYLPGSPNIYFNETLVNLPQGVSPNDTTAIVFPVATPYYPLGDTNEISIYAYSGTAPNDEMILAAGTGITNDAILSNYGKRRSDPQVRPEYAPTGTPGSSADPAEILQFRHVMTQVNVSVVTDPDSEVDQLPTNLQFRMNGVVATGRYGIRAQETETAVNTSGAYTLRLGTNYLVPNGFNMVGNALSYLAIDDYIATSQDLANFTIQPAGAEQQMLLMPGYSYNLVFTVGRLGIQHITLQKVNWNRTEITGDVNYRPYNLFLGLGNYNSPTAEPINRAVLRTADRSYVGKKSEDSDSIEFVILPPSGVTNISLYTERGLLLEADLPTGGYTYNENGSSLNLELSVGGMIPVDPVQPYDEGTNPYAVYTPLQFMNVANDLGASYRQMNTIDLRTLNLIDAGRIFNGFGAFTGTYDGDGNRIDALDIQAAGLFASNSGILRGIRITTGTMDATGQTVAGTLCGTNTGTIVGCINESRITTTNGATETLGGICGTNSGRIIGCLNTGTILNGTTVGGICGTNQNTAAGAIMACVNTGMLNPQAEQLGYICGSSTTSTNNVVQTSFALVGSAQRIIGGPEIAVGSGNVGTTDVSSLEPAILRNGLQAGQGEPMRIVNRLNAALATTPWGTTYQYVYNNAVTAVTWPAPIVIENNP